MDLPSKVMKPASNVLGLLSRTAEKGFRKVQAAGKSSRQKQDELMSAVPAELVAQDITHDLKHLTNAAFWRRSQTEGYYLCITIKEARNLLPKGTDNKSADPFCRIIIGDEEDDHDESLEASTRVCSRSTHPVWEQSFLFPLSKLKQSTSVRMAVYQKDLGRMVFMGQVQTTLGYIVSMLDSVPQPLVQWQPLCKKRPNDQVYGELCIGWSVVGQQAYNAMRTQLAIMRDPVARREKLVNVYLQVQIHSITFSESITSFKMAHTEGLNIEVKFGRNVESKFFTARDTPQRLAVGESTVGFVSSTPVNLEFSLPVWEGLKHIKQTFKSLSEADVKVYLKAGKDAIAKTQVPLWDVPREFDPLPGSYAAMERQQQLAHAVASITAAEPTGAAGEQAEQQQGGGAGGATAVPSTVSASSLAQPALSTCASGSVAAGGANTGGSGSAVNSPSGAGAPGTAGAAAGMAAPLLQPMASYDSQRGGAAPTSSPGVAAMAADSKQGGAAAAGVSGAAATAAAATGLHGKPPRRSSYGQLPLTGSPQGPQAPSEAPAVDRAADGPQRLSIIAPPAGSASALARVSPGSAPASSPQACNGQGSTLIQPSANSSSSHTSSLAPSASISSVPGLKDPIPNSTNCLTNQASSVTSFSTCQPTPPITPAASLTVLMAQGVPALPGASQFGAPPKRYHRVMEAYSGKDGGMQIEMSMLLVKRVDESAVKAGELLGDVDEEEDEEEGAEEASTEGSSDHDGAEGEDKGPADDEAPPPLPLPEPLDVAIMEAQVAARATTVFNVMFGKDSERFREALNNMEGLTNMNIGQWAVDPDTKQKSRVLTYTKPIKIPIPLAPKSAAVTETQTVQAQEGGGFVVQVKVVSQVPKGDCFNVLTQIACSQTGPRACRVRVTLKVDFFKSVGLLKGTIQAGSEKDTKRYIANVISIMKGLAEAAAAGVPADLPIVTAVPEAAAPTGALLISGAQGEIVPATQVSFNAPWSSQTWPLLLPQCLIALALLILAWVVANVGGRVVDALDRLAAAQQGSCPNSGPP